MQEAGESGCDQQNSRQIVHRNLSGEISGKRNSICVSRVRRTLRRGGGQLERKSEPPFAKLACRVLPPTSSSTEKSVLDDAPRNLTKAMAGRVYNSNFFVRSLSRVG